MKSKSCAPEVDRKRQADRTVLVVGGSGGLTSRYRDVVEQHGWSLRHYEDRIPAGARRGAGGVALVVIMVTMVSHSLRAQVQSMVEGGAPIIYLRSASVSALRTAVCAWAG